MATANEIVAAVRAKAGNDKHSDWYVGIAADAEAALFERHKVSKAAGSYVSRTADSSSIAREAESTLHADGFDGGPGGGDASTKSVYAYKKTSTTSQN